MCNMYQAVVVHIPAKTFKNKSQEHCSGKASVWPLGLVANSFVRTCAQCVRKIIAVGVEGYDYHVYCPYFKN